MTQAQIELLYDMSSRIVTWPDDFWRYVIYRPVRQSWEWKDRVFSLETTIAMNQWELLEQFEPMTSEYKYEVTTVRKED